MRLQEMYYTIKNALDHWETPTFREEKQKNGAPSLYECINMESIVKLLAPARCLPDVEEFLDDLYDISPGMVAGEHHLLDVKDRNAITSYCNALKVKLSAMQSMCETLGLEANSEGFDVKLPPDISLLDASKCMDDLDTVFSQCPIFPKDCEIKFSGVDIGSAWLTFVVTGTCVVAVLRVIAELIDKVIVIRTHETEYNMEEEQLRSLRLSNDLIENVCAAHKVALDTMTSNTIEELSKEYGVTENEDKERIRLSIERLGKWIDKGMEIHAGIGAPKETKLLFPQIERQSFPLKDTKELSCGETE